MTEPDGPDQRHVEAVVAQASRAKEREIEAHRRAAEMHDAAAAAEQRGGRPDLAERARERAAKARADALAAEKEHADANERIAAARARRSGG